MTCSSSLFLKNRIGRGSMQRLVVALFVALDVVLDVAARCTAGTGATPAAFYLGLCRLRGVLFPPAPHDHAAGGTVLLCRHDGAALILDFKPRLANRCSRGAILGRIRAVILEFRPRLANRCSRGADLWQNRASILNFKPRLANRCSAEVKTGVIRASILDFRPRLANRSSQKVKTRAIHAAHLQHAFHHALTMRLAIDSLHRHRFDSGGKSGC